MAARNGVRAGVGVVEEGSSSRCRYSDSSISVARGNEIELGKEKRKKSV